jgi:hypothetical protein
MKFTRLFLNHPPWTFSGSGIGLRLLAARWKSATMPDPPVASEVHQALNVHRNFTPKVTFDGKFRHATSKGFKLFFREIFDHHVFFNLRLLANFLR